MAIPYCRFRKQPPQFSRWLLRFMQQPVLSLPIKPPGSLWYNNPEFLSIRNCAVFVSGLFIDTNP